MVTQTNAVERRRFTAKEYSAMVEAGILAPGDGIELLDGDLFCKYDGRRRRFTVGEYYKMAEVGILGPDERVELQDGEIVIMPPMGDWHAACTADFAELLEETVGRRASKRVQTPLRLNDTYAPEPDLMLLRRRADSYRSGTPRPEDVLLLIEVADTTIGPDRRCKITAYARAGIPELWLAVRAAQNVEVHSEPVEGVYTRVEIVGMDSSLTPAAFPDITIPVIAVMYE